MPYGHVWQLNKQMMIVCILVATITGHPRESNSWIIHQPVVLMRCLNTLMIRNSSTDFCLRLPKSVFLLSLFYGSACDIQMRMRHLLEVNLRVGWVVAATLELLFWVVCKMRCRCRFINRLNDFFLSQNSAWECERNSPNKWPFPAVIHRVSSQCHTIQAGFHLFWQEEIGFV